MATDSHTSTCGALARAVSAALAALALTTAITGSGALSSMPAGLDGDELVGYAGHKPDSTKPKLTACFLHESYRPGDRARLVITDTARDLALQFFRAGDERRATSANDVLLGEPVAAPAKVGAVAGRRVVEVRIGNWPSGVYYAQLTSGARTGYAVFVLRPRELGEHRVAVVLPTQTWQAYNFRDDDGDGVPNTWYVAGSKAQLVRAALNRGVPAHWKYYDAPFLRWLRQTGREVDYLSDADLRSVSSGAALAQAYSLLVFSGHHEYVTQHEYDVVTGFRDRGGNLAFLSANNFYWKITIANGVMTRVARWRDLGRPEAALVGVQYVANDNGEHRGPWILRRTQSVPWLFAGTGLHNGDRLGSGGIEIDMATPSSPRGLRIIGEIPNLLGRGLSGQMSYYETPAGARVFAAGAFTLAGSVWNPRIQPVLENLWRRLADDGVTTAERRAMRAPTAVRSVTIAYRAHDGVRRDAVVVLPRWYRPGHNPALPLVISPHGRGLDGESNARLWGSLPAAGAFAVVSPDGEGRRLGRVSWGAPGQIDDLARMPQLIQRALPWLRIDASRVYAVGGSMGGQETLLLVARHPRVLAGAAAVDSVADFALQYRNYPRLGCNAVCRKAVGSLGAVLQGLARREVGGTPASARAAFAARSPLTFAGAIAASGVPLQIWWSHKDKIVVDAEQQSGRLAETLRALGTRAPLEEYVGRWIHTAPLRADRQLPLIVERFGLLPPRWGQRPKLRYIVTSGAGAGSA